MHAVIVRKKLKLFCTFAKDLECQRSLIYSTEVNSFHDIHAFINVCFDSDTESYITTKVVVLHDSARRRFKRQTLSALLLNIIDHLISTRRKRGFS